MTLLPFEYTNFFFLFLMWTKATKVNVTIIIKMQISKRDVMINARFDESERTDGVERSMSPTVS